MLTKQQKNLLELLQQEVAETGLVPSFEEMKDALGLKSKSGIHRLISGLEERGYIRRLPHRARALEILKPITTSIQKKTDSVKKAVVETINDIMHIPLMGQIAAGTPIEALQHTERTVPMPASQLGRGTFYALTISGDSMKDAGILDGDIAIIRETQQANDNSIIVALVDNEEATLKTLKRRGKTIELHPANAAYQTQTYDAARVKIQGELAGLYREY